MSELIFKTGNQNARCYINTLGSGLLHFVAYKFGKIHPWVFQKDNAPIYTAIETRKWITERKLRTLPWLAKFPDLNIIKNVRGYMARTLYKCRKQYGTVEEFKQAIEDVLDSINED